MDYTLKLFCELDKYAEQAYCAIHDTEETLNIGDITKADEKMVADFNTMFGGSPCQDFSVAGKLNGAVWTCENCGHTYNPLEAHYDNRDICPVCNSTEIEKTRSSLLVEWLRFLREKRPRFAIYENVKNITGKKFKETFDLFLKELDEYGYNVYWKVLNAKNFGVPQERKRIYIIGTKNGKPDMEGFKYTSSKVGDVLEKGLECSKSPFVEKLLSHYSVEDLCGKAIKDKRGGENNIHSWDFELKGSVSEKQHELLNKMLKERRKHKWAEMYGIDWMDGMPLTLEMISTFFDDENLEELLEDLTDKKYVVKEHPKRRIKRGKVFERVEDVTLPMGYNIVAGKMSFEVSKILSPEEQSPTLVAMDMQHLYVVDGKGIRTLSLREGLNLFGYPKSFKFDIPKEQGYDLLGNTVVVPVIKEVAGRVLDVLKKEKELV